MKVREVFRYELEYRLRSVSTWLYAGFLFLIAIWTFLATAEGSAFANAPVRIAGGTAIAGVLGMLVTAAIFGDAAVRDFAAEMDPLLFTSSIRKSEYLGGRFLAALTVNVLVMLAVPLGHFVATTVVESVQSVKVGPFRILAYMQPWPLFVLPNLIVAGAILYAIGVLARRVIPVYLGAIILFIGYIAAANAAERITNPVLALLSDPIGIHTLEVATRYWAEAEQNVRLVGFPADLVLNRVIWLAVAAAMLALMYRRFRFAHAPAGSRRRGRMAIAGGVQRREGLVVADAVLSRSRPVEVPRAAGTFDFRMPVRQALAVARRSLEEIAASRWFVVVLLGCTGVTLLMGWNVGDTVFDTSTWPVTMLVAGTVLAQRVTPIIYALVALYAGELVWRNRDAKVDEIVDAAPVPEGVALIGHFLALVIMIAAMQAAQLIGGLLIQVLQGYYRFEPGLYIEILFGLKLVDYLLFAALAVTIQVLVNHKYLGHMALLLAFLSVLTLRMLGIVDHHLLLYSTAPEWTYSDMNGFGPFIRPWLWFKLYWAAWALLLAVLASLFWVRGREPGVRHRLARARERFGGSLARAAGAAIVLIVVLGGFVFYNTNILNEYRSGREAGLPQADYEKRYKRFDGAPQPTIVDAKLREEIYPDQPAVDLRGSYRLVNRSGVAIDSVHVVSIDPGVSARSISFDRDSKAVVADDETGYRIFALARPLEPGDSLRLEFDVSFRPRGFPNGGIQTKVVSNGAVFDRSWLPAIGYQPVNELSDEDTRRRFGLEPRSHAPGPDDAAAVRRRWQLRNEDLVHLDAVVGTAADQTVIMAGMLRRSWTENGRRYFHYETRPALFGANVISGRYAVLEDRWMTGASATPATRQTAQRQPRDATRARGDEGLALRIFHDPAHSSNLDLTVRSMKASLAYYTEQFGPYPYNELRIVEIPRYGGFGRALAHTITFTEDYFLSRVKEDQLDQPFYGTAHEVAHQWWGGQVRGASVRGYGFLTESLANYSAMMVVERTYGLEAARRVYAFQMDRYLRGRANFSREVPLLDVEDQPYIAYRKGAIAMYTLRLALGEERVDTALRRYLEKYRDAGPPYPTSRDLYAELRAVTPDSLQYLLTDLFETVTLWDVRTERAAVERTGSGEFLVTLDVVARKARADSVGRMAKVPMNDLVEIGVFAPGEGDALGEPLYLERQRIRSGKQTIRITVPSRPARAGIDPWHELIDRDKDDNIVSVSDAVQEAKHER
ncbi:MAG TPA: M1 family aminopeptidase [Gemmatimonadaceae bacterium]|nr:M1 family aminopeptidase [Gemmatimonadaceae bacterium]